MPKRFMTWAGVDLGTLRLTVGNVSGLHHGGTDTETVLSSTLIIFTSHGHQFAHGHQFKQKDFFLFLFTQKLIHNGPQLAMLFTFVLSNTLL